MPRIVMLDLLFLMSNFLIERSPIVRELDQIFPLILCFVPPRESVSHGYLGHVIDLALGQFFKYVLAQGECGERVMFHILGLCWRSAS